MPRLSTKRNLLLELEKNLLTRRTDAMLRLLLLDSSSEESGRENTGSDYETRSTDDSTGTIDEIITIGLENAIERISSHKASSQHHRSPAGHFLAIPVLSLCCKSHKRP